MHIRTVGLKGLKTPIRVKEKNGGLQNTIATISMQAQLCEGNHENCVAAFTSILDDYLGEFSVASFSSILPRLQKDLQATSVRLEMTFPYFIDKKAPVSDTHSLMEYECTFSGGIGDDDGFILSVSAPVTTLCPCSKEISSGGAHNQRGEVTLNVKFKNFVWVEDLIEIIEQSASCEVYALLKRPDEKYVTEKAFNNPMFVEDVVRKVALLSLEHPDITWFSAGVESFESIHKHSAYAYVDSDEVR
ncbi:GTP cyclohydrolase I [Desulforhopalus singaporensis]|uniref:GTP cyclohydrolase I n=2 Tax=Desulforhopalus singaporensis TaxID=91360 RepID=A0A1H0U6D0_9BACT|nr:GTP cyclohydrolase I [Desulforhopalus singaporensis]